MRVVVSGVLSMSSTENPSVKFSCHTLDKATKDGKKGPKKKQQDFQKAVDGALVLVIAHVHEEVPPLLLEERGHLLRDLGSLGQLDDEGVGRSVRDKVFRGEPDDGRVALCRR